MSLRVPQMILLPSLMRPVRGDAATVQYRWARRAASPAMILAAALLADCHALAMGAGRDPAQEARSDGDQITPAIVALRKLLNFHFKKKKTI